MDNARIILLAADVTALRDEALFRRALDRLPAFRRERVLRIRRRDEARLSTGAWLLAAEALCRFGADAGDAVIGDHGKPLLPGGVFFNLSHSGDYAICAAGTCEVGCDIERIQPFRPSFVQRFFTMDEAAMLASQEDGAARETMFCRLWTLKESYIKATGLGMALPLRSFSVIPGNGGVSLRHDPDGRDYAFAEYGGIDGYRVAVCAVGKEAAFPDKAETVTITDLLASEDDIY